MTAEVELAREGGTELWLPPTVGGRGPGRRAPVFYNPSMALDRDLAVAVVARARELGRPLRTGWEMLSATGVRGIRCAVEAGRFETLTLSDQDPEALRVLERNVARHPGRGLRVEARDARGALPPPGVDWVDLDPYGTPVPFLPAALDSLVPGGLLGIAATDMPVLAGAAPAVCERRYGGRPVRGRLGPEGGLRLLLAYLERSAGARGRTIRPLVAYVGDHHVRAYVGVEPRTEGGPPPPIAVLDPERWDGPPLGGRGPFGPLWIGPLFHAEFVAGLRPPAAAAEPRRIAVFLDRLRAESPVDAPFYYEPNEICGREGLATPWAPAAFVERLRALGHAAARTHARPEGFRTSAPRSVVFALAREADRAAQSQKERVRA
ncbi:MAG: hypothetical protein ACYCPN_01305 [Thermoplasmata archaeon]